jgi:hypothetical protein
MQVLILFILGLAFTGCDTLYDAPPWAPPVSGGSVTGLSATDAWHRAESVMGHVQHLSLESLVKMDHFQKEPPLNLKGTTGGQGGLSDLIHCACTQWKCFEALIGSAVHGDVYSDPA